MLAKPIYASFMPSVCNAQKLSRAEAIGALCPEVRDLCGWHQDSNCITDGSFVSNVQQQVCFAIHVRAGKGAYLHYHASLYDLWFRFVQNALWRKWLQSACSGATDCADEMKEKETAVPREPSRRLLDRGDRSCRTAAFRLEPSSACPKAQS